MPPPPLLPPTLCRPRQLNTPTLCFPFSAGACNLVTKSMATFPDNIDVQHAACVAVGNLANRDTENKKRLGSAGACNKV